MRKRTVYRRATTADSSQPFSALVFHVLAWQCNRCSKLYARKERALICCAPCSLRRFRRHPALACSMRSDDPTDDPYCTRCGFSKQMADTWRRKHGRAYARRQAMLRRDQERHP